MYWFDTVFQSYDFLVQRQKHRLAKHGKGHWIYLHAITLKRSHKCTSRKLERRNSGFSCKVRVFILIFPFSVWIPGRWSTMFMPHLQYSPTMYLLGHNVNIKAVKPGRYRFWDTLISKDINTWPIQNYVISIFSVNRCAWELFWESWKKKGFHVIFWGNEGWTETYDCSKEGQRNPCPSLKTHFHFPV